VAAHRDYPTLVAAARGLRGLPLEEAMGRCTRLMWDAYSPLAGPSVPTLSWIGFYRREGLDAQGARVRLADAHPRGMLLRVRVTGHEPAGLVGVPA
jgi:hypothetical protein